MKPMSVHDLSLEEKLLSERRTCVRCSFVVLNPFVERCPRCYKPLQKVELSCRGCLHSNICPAVGVNNFKEAKNSS